MMLSGKYDVKELNGVNCAIVEENISQERAAFLEELLEFNGHKVEIVKTEKVGENGPAVSYTIGVHDITFNLSLALFSRRLRTLNDVVLLPHYWTSGETGDENYWREKSLKN